MNIYSRLIGAFFTSALIVLAVLPVILKIFKKVHLEQRIRPEGPAVHKKKSGTPTMGGIVLILSIVASIFWMKTINVNIYFLLLIVACSALIGVIDDYICYKRKRSLGLRARDKFLAQILIGLGLAVFLNYFYTMPSGIWGVSNKLLLVYPFWVVLVYIASCNAVNLTDGLDGLAASLCMIVFWAYTVIGLFLGEFSLAIFAIAAFGACFGFLFYNVYPAKIFMGDAGALGLGGALACLALYTRTELLFLILGGIFVIEALSVIIQVFYFKITKGKRIFKMSPLHHHYELLGWPEAKVTIRFVIAGVVLVILGMFLFVITAFKTLGL